MTVSGISTRLCILVLLLPVGWFSLSGGVARGLLGIKQLARRPRTLPSLLPSKHHIAAPAAVPCGTASFGCEVALAFIAECSLSLHFSLKGKRCPKFRVSGPCFSRTFGSRRDVTAITASPVAETRKRGFSSDLWLQSCRVVFP